MSPNRQRVAVLGAGLQGAATALALACRGARVDLYERNPVCLAEASAHNEGKIHLGFVYALDTSLATAKLMADGALTFGRLMRGWVGAAIETVPQSSPFHYVVHRDSLIAPEAFAAHGRAVAAILAERGGGDRAAYFGRDAAAPVRRLSESEAGGLGGPAVAAVFATEEIALDPEGLAAVVRDRLAATPEIAVRAGRTVTAVADRGTVLTVTAEADGVADTAAYDFVVNTLGSGRLAIDRDRGLEPPAPWSFRFKYFVRAAVGGGPLPSATIVLGPFGDIVDYGGGIACLSWYPTGMAALSTAVVPPDLPPVLSGPPAAEMRQGIVAGLATVCPELAGRALRDVEVKGGWIFALGGTDINDPASGLHRRSAPGIHRQGRYLSVDTGKLTLAPLFAERAAALILP